MRAASLKVLWKRDGTCFRVAAYPLGFATKYVVEIILTGAALVEELPEILLSFSFHFFFLRAFRA